MTDDLPASRPLSSTGSVRPAVVVLPAVAFEPPFDELTRWLDRLPIESAYELPGLEGPLYVTDPDGGVAITTTGLGKVPAATTVAALWRARGIDLDGATVVSAGIAGAPPTRAALGSVFVADAILDWDRKHRWDPAEVASPGDGAVAVEQLTYEPEGSLHEPNRGLIGTARAAIDDVDLAEDGIVRTYQERYPTAPDHGPRVGVGPTVTSDEFWHGSALAREVESLCSAYGIDPYVTTQMEDAATAGALARFDAVDRHLSVRAVANYDRPAPGGTVRDSFEGIDESVELAAENAVRAGRAIVDEVR